MKLKTLLLFSSAITMASISFADVGAGLKVGTLGVGLDIATDIPGFQADKANVRFAGNYFTYSRSENLSRLAIDGKLKLQTFGMVGDWYPFAGSFRLTAGGYFNQNAVSVTGKPKGGSFNFNGTDYTPQQVGTLSDRAKLGTGFAPYAGIGWGNALGSGKQWGVFSDFGVLFTGSPKLSLSSQGGTLSNDPTLVANLENERHKAQKDIDFAWAYPVISVGVSYKF